jgi:CO/xanthine dehydrogenase FAD-binding subunit
MPLVNEGVSMPEKVLSLRQAGLNTIQRKNGSLAIGTTTTLTQMVKQTDVAILQEAAHSIGGWAIRNMGTIGGNLFAPPPAGDFAVALLALDASVTLVSKKGRRTVALEDFYTGFLMTELREGEIVEQILLPVPKGKTAYIKFGRKHASTPAVVTVATHIELGGGVVKEARLALNGVGPYPFRARMAEAALVGSKLDADAIEHAANLAMGEAQPFTDAVASEWYRRKMVAVIVRRTLEKIAGGG